MPWLRQCLAPNAEARVHSQASVYGICVAWSDTGRCCALSVSNSPHRYRFTNAPNFISRVSRACWRDCDSQQHSSVPFVTDCCHPLLFVLQHSELFYTINFLFALLPIPSSVHFVQVLSPFFSMSMLLYTKCSQYFTSPFYSHVVLCYAVPSFRLIIYFSNIFLQLSGPSHFKDLCISFSLDMRARSSLCTPFSS